jgi:hypothetical protein
MLSATERQRRRRRRQRDGRIVVRVELDEVEAEERLVAAGLLDPLADHDAKAIERALDDAEIIIVGRRVTT